MTQRIGADELRRRIPESEFQATVVELARLRGWRLHHTRPARTQKGWRTPIQGDPGFPDLTMVRGDRVLFVELKSERGRVSPHQEAWLEALRAAGAEVAVWRPRDWPKIVSALS